MHSRMSPKELRDAGARLVARWPDTYGRGWQTALALELGVSPRTVRYWLAGRSRIPVVVGRALRLILF